jgi:hypothetical protein
VPLTKAQGVFSGHLSATVSGPSRAALRPAAPLPRPPGVPVRLVGKAARPTPGARVVAPAGVDLGNEAPEPRAAQLAVHRGPTVRNEEVHLAKGSARHT